MAVKEAKICLVGVRELNLDQTHNGVGKTCLAHRFARGTFPNSINPTVGLGYFSKKVLINGVDVLIKLFDVGGHDRYHAISDSYYHGTVGVLAVFDITDNVSFEKMKIWIREIEQFVKAKLEIGIVGNKTDLEHLRQVCSKDGEDFAAEIGGFYSEVSVRRDSCVDQLILQIGSRLDLHSLPSVLPCTEMEN